MFTLTLINISAFQKASGSVQTVCVRTEFQPRSSYHPSYNHNLVYFFQYK